MLKEESFGLDNFLQKFTYINFTEKIDLLKTDFNTSKGINLT